MEEKSIKFEDMPNAITGVLKKLSVLESKIDGLYNIVQSEKVDTWFTVTELRVWAISAPAPIARTIPPAWSCAFIRHTAG